VSAHPGRGLINAAYTWSKLWRRLRTTNVIDRVFMEMRRRTVNVPSLEWRSRTLQVFTQAA
jgi:transposase-like protein